MAVARAMESEVDSFTVENRLLEFEDTYTYHIYEEAWSSVIEVLVCHRDTISPPPFCRCYI